SWCFDRLTRGRRLLDSRKCQTLGVSPAKPGGFQNDRLNRQAIMYLAIGIAGAGAHVAAMRVASKPWGQWVMLLVGCFIGSRPFSSAVRSLVLLGSRGETASRTASDRPQSLCGGTRATRLRRCRTRRLGRLQRCRVSRWPGLPVLRPARE